MASYGESHSPSKKLWGRGGRRDKEKQQREENYDNCLNRLLHQQNMAPCEMPKVYVKVEISAEDPKKYIYNGCSKVVVTRNTALAQWILSLNFCHGS